MRPAPIGPQIILWGCIIFMFAIAFGSCQPAPADAATVHSFESEGWSYELTDVPYEDERLGYAVQGARMYWGRLPDSFRVLSMKAALVDPTSEAGVMAIGMWRLYALGDKGAIWINEAYYADRIYGKRVQRRVSLCTSVVHEIGHALDQQGDLDPHRLNFPGDPEHVMQGFAPKVCWRLTEQDKARKARIWCKRHKRECRKKKPDLAAQTLRPRSHR